MLYTPHICVVVIELTVMEMICPSSVDAIITHLMHAAINFSQMAD